MHVKTPLDNIISNLLPMKKSTRFKGLALGFESDPATVLVFSILKSDHADSSRKI